MTTDRPVTRVYPLDPQTLSEEQMAVVFAMTSRSPEPFDEIAGRVSEENASDFNEKWVIGYGHASVAEHAVVHMALENISRVAADEVENNRLASYTEKSSRYQVIDRGHYHIPAEIAGTTLEAHYRTECDTLFGTYEELIARMTESLRKTTERPVGQRRTAYELALRRIATDACRNVLPASTLTNVGMTANARTLEHAMSKLMSHNLAETRALGALIRDEARLITPTLVKYADRNSYLEKDPDGTRAGAEAPKVETASAVIVAADPEPLATLAAALKYTNSANTWQQCLDEMRGSEEEDLSATIDQALAAMGIHDRLPREFETVHLTVEFTMDYGALREYRRHRMLTPLLKPLTTTQGYHTPPRITQHGLTKMYGEAMARAEALFNKLAQASPAAAAYAVSHGHLQRTTAKVNLRELHHMIRLRTGDAAHESIRTPMKRALAQVERTLPPAIVRALTRP